MAKPSIKKNFSFTYIKTLVSKIKSSHKNKNFIFKINFPIDLKYIVIVKVFNEKLISFKIIKNHIKIKMQSYIDTTVAFKYNHYQILYHQISN